jgi:Nuclease-related domain
MGLPRASVGTSAGTFAEQRFRTGRAAWRRKVMPKLAWLLVPCAAIGLALTAAGGQPWDFAGGALFGCAVCMAMWVWDSPPAHVQHWGDGAAGERKTAKALAPLEERGWHVLHDQPEKYGNRDHVVVGPGGLFLIDTKCPSGQLEVVGDRLVGHRLDGFDLHHTDLGRKLRGAAAGLSAELRDDGGRSPFVNGVAAVWGDLEAGVVKGDRMWFVHGDRLCEWLLSQPRRFDDRRVAELAEAVAAL